MRPLVLMLLLAASASPQWRKVEPPKPQQQQPPPAQAEEGVLFRTGTAIVRVDVQVVERNRVVANLTKDDFTVLDEGVPQPILHFGHEAEPLSVLLLLDVSGSMRRYVEQMAATAREALKQLHPGDRVAVMLFSRRAELREELTPDLARIERDLKDAVREQSLGSGTQINPALLAAAAYMGQSAGSAGRRAILILTDNQALHYQSPDEPVVRALLAADTVLNAIVVGRGERPEKPKPGVYRNPDFTPADVFSIAEQTGGEAVRAEHAGASFRDMIERIRTRYALEYRAPDTATPGTFRQIRVELSPKYARATVRARTGYIVK